MTEFEELQSQWEKQSQPEPPIDGANRVREKIASIQQKQGIANIVLTSTGIILVFFFFYISAYKVQTVMIGLLLMIGALVIRIAIEFFSIGRLRSLNVSVDVVRFKAQLTKYYKNRIKIHLIITPLIVLVYCVGFVMLLPSFKANLSEGFYSYIVISSIVLLVVLGLFITKQIRNELRMLKDLKS